MFKSGPLFHPMGSLRYIIWQHGCYNSWRTAPGLLHCLQSPAQCSTVLCNVINPVWPIFKRVMASCKISIHPYPTLAGFETFSNETLHKREKRNLEPGNETVTQSKQKLDLYSFTLPGLTDFKLLSRKGLKMSEKTSTLNSKHTWRRESLLVTCAYDHWLISPVGSHSTVWIHPFLDGLFFFTTLNEISDWKSYPSCGNSTRPSTTNEEACLYGEEKNNHSQGGLGVTAGSFTGGLPSRCWTQ